MKDTAIAQVVNAPSAPPRPLRLEDTPDVWRPELFAAFFGLSVSAVYKLAQLKVVPSMRLGDPNGKRPCIRFSRRAIEKLLERGELDLSVRSARRSGRSQQGASR